jgi:4-diphosphocytidyl-2-C-methyl-D-erythritol kinase
MICFPNAKINLGLNIISRRKDGYHNLETVFYPIPLKEALEVVKSTHPAGTFIQTGIPVDGNPDDNLVMKAYRLFREKYTTPEMDIYLRKQIPFGAGLGGGSADAAFMLKLLAKELELNISDETFENMASTLGADCAFFIRNKPVFASGIGTVFEPIELDLSEYQFVLVKPEIHVSTKEAYAMVKPSIPATALKKIIRRPVSEWKDNMVNDFEASVFQIHPEIREIKEKLYRSGALYASMSGSGSAVFGIFDPQWNIEKLDNSLQSHYLRIWNRLDTHSGISLR